MDDPLGILRAHRGKRHKVHIERAVASDPFLSGYVLGLSGSLCLVHAFDDFEPDGYSIFRLSDVVDVRSGDYERHWDHMLENEGLLGGLDSAPIIDLSTIETVLASADRECGRMIIECEDDEEDIEDFYIGVVARIGDESLLFHHFDALGNWESPGALIDYADITLVQLETPYIRRFWPYIRGNPTS